MSARLIRSLGLFGILALAGCHSAPPAVPSVPASLSPPEQAKVANQLFLNQKTFEPWVLTSTDIGNKIPAYYSDGHFGVVVGPDDTVGQMYQAGKYQNGQIVSVVPHNIAESMAPSDYQQKLDMQTGRLTIKNAQGKTIVHPATSADELWQRLWQTSDIVIDGDPEAQQVTHANLFYLLSSTFPGSTFSIPPMGLSSSVYGGHIFWDADVWMLPALIVQHPDYAKPIVDYRYKLLAQARRNAKQHGFLGAEYPWESADTGAEVAPSEFAKERHITADVAFAAWQYYLWTGDKAYLRNEGWPLLQATAQYWASRVAKGADGKYHVNGVLSPDETAGVVNDDAYTNAVVKYNLLAATAAAAALHQKSDPHWAQVADALFLPVDAQRGIIAENAAPMTDRFMAKQADALLLIHPLGFTSDGRVEGHMLDFYAAHTIPTGPAMTSSIESIVAARLGRTQQSLDLFHDSYRPFERGPWDAFSEKRTTNNVYFLTGMAGCVQSVLYGFAGIQAVSPWEHGAGQKLIEDGDVALYCNPHLPPGWGKLTVKGVRFRGRLLDVTITPDNEVSVTAAATSGAIPPS